MITKRHLIAIHDKLDYENCSKVEHCRLTQGELYSAIYAEIYSEYGMDGVRTLVTHNKQSIRGILKHYNFNIYLQVVPLHYMLWEL